MLSLEGEVCNFSRNKLHRRHFSKNVLKAETAFLFALFQRFWENTFEMTTLEFFFKRLQEVLNNFCKNELLCTNIFFETYWRQTQLFYLFYFVCIKLLEKSFELTIVELFFKKLRVAVAVPEWNPIMDIFLRTSRRQRQLISFALFKMNVEIWETVAIKFFSKKL